MNTSTAITIAAVFAVLALLVQLWIMWRNAYNRNHVNKYVARVVKEQTDLPLINAGGEIEWRDLSEQVPTFKAGA